MTAPDRAQRWQATRVAVDDDAGWSYLIFEQPAGVIVGSVALHRRTDLSRAEIGYWVRSDRTGRGYATSAAGLVFDAAFCHLADVDRVEIRMDEANLASAAVPDKLGFVLDRREDRPIATPGHAGRGLVWAITRERWADITSTTRR